MAAVSVDRKTGICTVLQPVTEADEEAMTEFLVRAYFREKERESLRRTKDRQKTESRWAGC